MEYVISGIAGIALLLVIILLINNRRQSYRLKRNLRDIKNIRTSSQDYLDFFK